MWPLRLASLLWLLGCDTELAQPLGLTVREAVAWDVAVVEGETAVEVAVVAVVAGETALEVAVVAVVAGETTLEVAVDWR